MKKAKPHKTTTSSVSDTGYKRKPGTCSSRCLLLRSAGSLHTPIFFSNKRCENCSKSNHTRDIERGLSGTNSAVTSSQSFYNI